MSAYSRFAGAWSGVGSCVRILRIIPLKNKRFEEERTTEMGLFDINNFTILEPQQPDTYAIQGEHHFSTQIRLRWISWRAMIMRCSSLVPSPMVSSGASR